MQTTQTPSAIYPWRAALYIRLSRDDGDKLESNSVTYQREILKEHLKLRPDITIHDTYIDDGWSGTNFDRPGFQRMMVPVRPDSFLVGSRTESSLAGSPPANSMW